MSASGIIEAEVFRSEQVSRLARTSDPSSPEKGDAWIRTDVQPTTNSVAALRVQGGSGYLEAPLFDPSVTLGQDVYVGQRFVFSDGTEGHLLVTDQGGAVGSPRVVTSSGAEYQAHDATEVNVIPDSAVARWTADEGSGSTLGDSIGSADATLQGPSWETSTVKVGDAALNYNGTDDYSELDAGRRSFVSSGAWTVTAWIYPNNVTGRNAVTGGWIETDNWDSPLNSWIIDNGVMQFWDDADYAWRTANTSLSTDTWYFVGLRYSGSGSTIEFWHNNAQDGSGDQNDSGAREAAFTHFGAGRDNAERHFDGIIDEVVLYDAYLSDSELTGVYDDQV